MSSIVSGNSTSSSNNSTNKQASILNEEPTYKKEKVLFESKLGKVYKISEQNSKKFYCLKSIYYKEDFKYNNLLEIDILQNLNHPNIIKFKEAFKCNKPNRCINIITEYCEYGDLLHFIENQKGKFLSENFILDIFAQIVIGLNYIHNHNIIHRDIKPQNIFLTKNNINNVNNFLIKIGDFGISKKLSGNCKYGSTFVGTCSYMSPEMIENKKYTIKTDIWSLGVLLYELTCLKKPFISRKINSLFEKIKKCKIKKIPDVYSSKLFDLIKSLLQIDEKKRPTTQELMNNILIKDRVKKFIESYNKNNNAINSNFNSIERCKTNNILKLKKDFKEKISNFINKNKDNKIINNNNKIDNNNINIKNQKFLNTNNSNEKYFEIYSGKNLSVNEPFTLIHNSSYNNFLNITNIRNIHRKNTFVQKNYNKKNYDNDSYELINNYSNKSINKNNNITNINKDNKESKSNNNFNIKLGNKLKFMNIVNNNNNNINNIINKKNQIKLPKIKNNINNNNMNFVKLENNKI
jgi:NIMA (never in mitosis gene a)-related kinase